MCDLDRIELLLADALPQEEQEKLRRHIETCPDCRRWQEMLEELRTEVKAPADLKERVMEAVRAVPQEAAQEKRKAPHRWLPVAAACVLLIMGIGTGIGMHRHNDAPPAAVMCREMPGADMPYRAGTAATYQCSDGQEGSLTEEQAEAVRFWLTEQGYTAEETDDAGVAAYFLAAEEMEGLHRAVSGLPISRADTWLFLPA